MLTPSQRDTLKAAILASPDTAQIYGIGDLDGLAVLLNANASPDFWVWRTAVSREEIYNDVSPAGTSWSYPLYRNQSATEQDTWKQMFMNDSANFSKPNLRAGIEAIFTSASAVNATHALAIGRRKARRFERIFATGAGSAVSPGAMTIEGALSTGELVGL